MVREDVSSLVTYCVILSVRGGVGSSMVDECSIGRCRQQRSAQPQPQGALSLGSSLKCEDSRLVSQSCLVVFWGGCVAPCSGPGH